MVNAFISLNTLERFLDLLFHCYATKTLDVKLNRTIQNRTCENIFETELSKIVGQIRLLIENLITIISQILNPFI